MEVGIGVSLKQVSLKQAKAWRQTFHGGGLSSSASGKQTIVEKALMKESSTPDTNYAAGYFTYPVLRVSMASCSNSMASELVLA